MSPLHGWLLIYRKSILVSSNTGNSVGIANLGAYARYTKRIGIDTIGKKEKPLTSTFIGGITAIDGVKLYGTSEVKKRIEKILSERLDFSKILPLL
ncbi:MAG: aminotransferase class V-fold PLP-dependent enzyme [Deltaproteobacteria bacterium]|nr:aminotransferase class V-fold PLP-dependent enzyme [Deltaproteobacteria bacterium]